MHQNWGKLLFMHWPIGAELLRPLIPQQLEIDTFDGTAWIGVVPFTMWSIRASFLPPIPRTSAFHELNVRTRAPDSNSMPASSGMSAMKSSGILADQA